MKKNREMNINSTEVEAESVEQARRNISNQKRKLQKKKRKRVIRRVLNLIVLVLLMGVFVLYDQSKYSKISTLRITGMNLYSKEMVLEDLGVHEGDRIYLQFSPLLNRSLKLEGIESVDSRVFYKNRIVNVLITEKRPLAYTESEEGLLVYYADASHALFDVANQKIRQQLPRLVGFDEERLSKEFIETLSKVNDGALSSVSEIYLTATDIQPDYMKLVMNNNYFIDTNLKTLPQLNNYASIISRVDSEARCLEFIEHGPTSQTQSAVVKACN